jgi:hypothetical protein
MRLDAWKTLLGAHYGVLRSVLGSLGDETVDEGSGRREGKAAVRWVVFVGKGTGFFFHEQSDLVHLTIE